MRKGHALYRLSFIVSGLSAFTVDLLVQDSSWPLRGFLCLGGALLGVLLYVAVLGLLGH